MTDRVLGREVVVDDRLPAGALVLVDRDRHGLPAVAVAWVGGRLLRGRRTNDGWEWREADEQPEPEGR